MYKPMTLGGTRFVPTNAMYRSTNRGKVYLSKRAREFKAEVKASVKRVIGGEKPCACDVQLRVALFFKDRRQRDVDGVKGLLDALEGVLYLNDSQIYSLTVTKALGCPTDSIELHMTPLLALGEAEWVE